MFKILLIEDDFKIGNLLTEFFEQFGHTVEHSQTPTIGLKNLRENPYDIVVLDIMLPEMNGFEVCREIRTNNQIPIIMLTARNDVTDRIVGLEIGADDYLPKPFNPRELLARISSILRRSQRETKVPHAKWKAKDLEVNWASRSAFYKNENLDLSTMEFELLKFFIENVNEVRTRDEIMNYLQGIDSNIFSRSIDINVSRLRSKLQDDSKNPNFIKTVWGKGYIFLQKGESYDEM